MRKDRRKLECKATRPQPSLLMGKGVFWTFDEFVYFHGYNYLRAVAQILRWLLGRHRRSFLGQVKFHCAGKRHNARNHLGQAHVNAGAVLGAICKWYSMYAEYCAVARPRRHYQ